MQDKAILEPIPEISWVFHYSLRMDIWHNMCSDEDSELDYMSWYDDSPSDYDYLYDEDDELYDLDYDDLDSFEEELEDIYEPPSSDEGEYVPSWDKLHIPADNARISELAICWWV